VRSSARSAAANSRGTADHRVARCHQSGQGCIRDTSKVSCAKRICIMVSLPTVAGDPSGLAEPALVLTPPDIRTAADDGLLTASEIVTLSLNADWLYYRLQYRCWQRRRGGGTLRACASILLRRRAGSSCLSLGCIFESRCPATCRTSKMVTSRSLGRLEFSKTAGRNSWPLQGMEPLSPTKVQHASERPTSSPDKKPNLCRVRSSGGAGDQGIRPDRGIGAFSS
jgi:hypothetical protein